MRRPLVPLATAAITAALVLGSLSQSATAVTSKTTAGQAAAGQAAAGQAAAWQAKEWVEVFHPNGTIKQVQIPKRATPPPAQALAAPNVVALQETGPVGSSFDLVFVGDGYTSSQIDLFHSHVAAEWNFLTTVEPYKTYKNNFNIWMVDVVSSQSGVDNDPTQGVLENTALDMYFWCGGTERLLCANTSKVFSYANYAPEVDQIVALANSTKYGGAGYGSSGHNVATASGGNSSSAWIVAHELGHSMGGLADEYDYPYGTYTGREPSEPNVTRYTASQLTSLRTKWYDLLGQPTPDGGVIGTYEGARYYLRGLYRPSQNSLMRSLGKPHNLIGVREVTEAILAEVGS